MQHISQTTRRPEYAIAFRSIRAAKNVIATLLILCILAQIGGTIAVHFARVLDDPTVAGATTQPDTGPAVTAAATKATSKPAESEDDLASIIRLALTYGLPGTRFAALALCLVLVIMMMFAVKLSLVERTGGMAGFISAFNWSLPLLLMLIPWKPILSSSLSCGALFNFGELTSADAALGQTPDQIAQAFFYARFLAYPCLALFTCLIVQAKFARGYSAADFRLDASGEVGSNPGVTPPMS
ncbi:MAG: hypothetical protein QGG42_00445 [Phycisphaerae bacterium]|jgi:hypothetical protein|nr:hypothetical protein [Phycisphaerae bacterium]